MVHPAARWAAGCNLFDGCGGEGAGTSGSPPTAPTPVTPIASVASSLFRTLSSAFSAGRTGSYTLSLQRMSNGLGTAGTWRFAEASPPPSTRPDGSRVSQQLQGLHNPGRFREDAAHNAPPLCAQLPATGLRGISLLPASHELTSSPLPAGTATTSVVAETTAKTPFACMETTAALLTSIARLGALADDVMPIHPDLHPASAPPPSPFAADTGYDSADSDGDDDWGSDFDDAPVLTPDELRAAELTFRREGVQVRLAQVAWQHRAHSVDTAFPPFAKDERHPPVTQVERIRAALQRDADAHIEALTGYDELPRDVPEILVDVPTLKRK